MRRLVLACLIVTAPIVLPVSASPVRATEKIDPYICPTAGDSNGLDCFVEAVVQTYTMCRQVKSIEVIEFGLSGAQVGVNGAKTESCIEKHKLSVAVPFQTALRESGQRTETRERLNRLHQHWLQSLANLIPGPEETDDGYKQRVVRPYGEFNEDIKAIRLAQAEAGSQPVVARTDMRKSKVKAAAIKAETTSRSAAIKPETRNRSATRDSAVKKRATKSAATVKAASASSTPATAAP